MSSIKLKHSGGNSVSLNPPSSAPTSSEVAFKLPNADGTSGQAIVTDASGQLAFASVGNSADSVAKAWVNFNGTGTIAIRSSYNVSSITDHGSGDFTINFTNNMPNTNYIVVGFANDETSRVCILGNESFSRDVSPNRDVFAVGSARMPTAYISGTNGESNNVDCSQVYLAFFGG